MLLWRERSDLFQEGPSYLQTWSWALHLLVISAKMSVNVMWLCCLAQEAENGAVEICIEGSFFPVCKYGNNYSKLQLLHELLMLKML